MCLWHDTVILQFCIVWLRIFELGISKVSGIRFVYVRLVPVCV
jgi:hypothetical protein